MAIRIADVPVQRLYGTQVAPGSDADVSANRLAVNVRQGTAEILVFAAAAVRLGFTPRVLEAWWYDDSADIWYDLLGSARAILDSARTGTAAFTLAAADYLYISLTDRVGGFFLEVDGTINNDNVASITFEYLSPGGFVSQAITDGTETGGNTTLAQNGLITLDAVPSDTDWINSQLSKALPSIPAVTGRGYWCRLSASALLDSVEIEQLQTLIADGMTGTTNDGIMDSGAADMMFMVATTEYTIPIDQDIGSLEFIAQAAVATTLNISWIKQGS